MVHPYVGLISAYTHLTCWSLLALYKNISIIYLLSVIISIFFSSGHLLHKPLWFLLNKL